MNLMLSSIAPLRESIVLLAPTGAAVPEVFRRVEANPSRHFELMNEMQRFRGGIYLKDGAIEEWQLDQQRHRQPADELSWHLLSLDGEGRVCGCARYRHYGRSASFGDLGVKASALAHSLEWGHKLKAAVEAEMEVARFRNMGYAEVGGWAIAEERRGTMDALKVALSTYSLAQLLGGSIGLTTATVRHGSASILRRIGGGPIQWDGGELPPYYDPQYKCVMEILRFDSSAPERKYSAWINRIACQLTSVPIICPDKRKWTAPVEALPMPMLSEVVSLSRHAAA